MQRIDKNDEWEVLTRFEYIGFSIVLFMISYYIWTSEGYLSMFFDLAEWFMIFGSSAVIIFSLLPIDPTLGKVKATLLAALDISFIIVLALRFGILNGILVPVYIFFTFLAIFVVKKAFDIKKVNMKRFSYIFAISVQVLLIFVAIFMQGTLIEIALAIILLFLSMISYFRFKYLIYFSFIGTIILFALAILPYYPFLGTDELTLDLYASHLLILGFDPYKEVFMSNAFSYFHFPLYYTTPYTTGGYVENFSYPVLIAILLVPAEIFKFNPNLEILAFTIGLISVIVAYFIKKGMYYSALISAVLTIVDINVINFADGSVPDAIWAFFLALSLISMPRTKISSLFYGLSISTKQIPLIILPFLLFYIYKEYGFKKMLLFTGIFIGVFTIINGYFIILSPTAYVSSILSPISGNLIGVGQGISMISFAGFYALKPLYFALMEIYSFVFLFVIYIRYYENIKFAYLIFPVIVLFFNYRFLFNYIIFWPILSMIVIPLVLAKRKVKTIRVDRRKAAALTLIFFLVPAVSALPMHQSEQFKITSVSNFIFNGENVTEMNVNITFSGGEIPGMRFRFFPYGDLGNLNGYLWKSVQTIEGNTWINFTIMPLYSNSVLSNSYSYRLDAYYGNANAFFSINFENNL
ncbi:protein-export membrane protein secF [Thermoplasma volcanium GSS1]|uniref:Protein-export membrane protein secF n=1 Tax=Thermoplasma volcanium (strain ATCC 51530 / DSM 4299 / JCM 9571 / NBRC 15438 / GSS1) TaxID=273116 RepID=Q97A17_THEVO|nr:glycosyltransferase family 87 protein [Thermoplasma volcanium]BAB60135.1 protein-export membrane protein secF [Thermoplasma volcanium GSS1]